MLFRSTVGLHASTAEAERLKKKHGHALASLVGEDEIVEVASAAGRAPRELSLQVLAQIIEPRAIEMLSLVRQDIEKAGLLKSLNGGIVLTGGGCLLPGMVEVAEQVFELPVRQGSPRGIGGLTDVVAAPTFATAVGLAAWGCRHVGLSTTKIEQPAFGISQLGGRVAGWFNDLFAPSAPAGNGRRASR